MFKPGDVVRRKADTPNSNWPQSRTAKVIEVRDAAVNLEGEWWLAKYFELVPDAHKPAETIGPVERVLTSTIPDSDGLLPPWRSIYNRIAKSEQPPEAQRDRKKFMDDAIAAERAERAKPVDVPHDYDLLLKDRKHEFDRAEKLKKELAEYQSLYGGRYDSSGQNVIAEPSKYDLLKMQCDERQATIEEQKDEIERLTNETSLLRAVNNKAAMLEREVKRLEKENSNLKFDIDKNLNVAIAQSNRVNNELRDEVDRLESELANCLSSPVVVENVPRNEIAWLIGWLNCDLSTEPLNDPPTDECRQRVATVNAWLSGGAK